MKQKNSTLLHYPINTGPQSGWSGYLSKLVALVLLVGSLGVTQQVRGQSALINNDAIALSYKPTNSSSLTSSNFAGSAGSRPFTTYAKLGQSSKPSQTAPNLGTYDLNSNSVITLTGGQLRGIIGDSGTNITNTRIQYRVYLRGTTSLPSYSNIALTTTQNSNDVGSAFTGTGSANINFLNGLVSGGNYIIDIRFQADASDGNGNVVTSTDLQGGDYFYATFYVTPPAITPPGGTTTWQGFARGPIVNGIPSTLSSDQDWLNTNNWTNGVPTYQADAIIPEKTGTIVYPLLNNPAATYEVRNLTMQGAQGETASKVTIGTATLRLYGNFSQESDPGLVGNTTNNSGVTDSTQNSTLVLAGADQTLSGNIIISDIIIAGSGTKSVLDAPIAVSNILAFKPTSVSAGVIIQSAIRRNSNIETQFNIIFSTNGRSYVQFLSTGKVSNVTGQAETKVSYIKGISRVDRSIDSRNNRQSNFGNIGLDVTSNHDINNLVVYRIVGSTLLGPTSTTAIPAKRQYQVIGDDDSNSTSTANSTIDVVFHYLDSGPKTNANELNGIDENNLTLYRTTENGPPYQALGGILDTLNNTVTRASLPSLPSYKLVLGDKTNPLPVSLVAFNAVRSNANTLLSWTTASEENNKGFNVQVSADGVTYRTLVFIASKSPNSSNEQNYKYTDIEAGKAGTRYYRLEQVDVDGKLNYSPVRAVGFDGAAATSVALVAYPNPFSNTVCLTVEGATTTEGNAYVKLVDMTGRTVLDQKVSLVGASLALGDLGNLRSGLYLAKVTLPDGSVQTVRVQKQ